MQSCTRYLRCWLAATGAIVALLAGLNALVDPYGIIGTPRVAGFNAVKPAAGPRVRTAKPYQLLRVRPHTVIVGNSRPEMGLNPASPCWAEADKPVYNFAQPGLPFVFQSASAAFAVARAPVAKVYFGVDFVDFVVRGRAGSVPPPIPVRLSAHAPTRAYVLQKLEDYATALFSLDAVVDSLRTLLLQRAEGTSDRTEAGFNPARDMLDAARVEGQRALFAQKLASLRRWLVEGNVHPVPDTDPRWQALRAALTSARENGVGVVLFVNPYHESYLNVLEEAGLLDAFEQWKQRLAAVAAAYDNVVLWDFALTHPYTSEPVPPAGVRGAVLRWFWEPAHYRSELGEAMLSVMTGRDCGPQVRIAFGRELRRRADGDRARRSALASAASGER